MISSLRRIPRMSLKGLMITLSDSKYSFVAGAATTVSGQATSLDAQNVAQVAGQPRQVPPYTQKVQLC